MSENTTFRWASLTHSGTRKLRNDDSLVAFASGAAGAEILAASGTRTLTNHDLIFAISDGMGGGNAGDIASSTILEQMSMIIPETFKSVAAGFYPDSPAHLRHAIRSIHEHINAAANGSPDKAGMAATLALAWFTPENLYLVNVGDSRIYLSRGGVLQQLTRDHTSAWAAWKRGEINEIEYRAHPRRAALYEVVGGGHQSVTPHYAAVAYQDRDRFLVCSDGLIDGLWERNLTNYLAACPDDPTETVAALSKRAIENSGTDDTSLIVITVSAAREDVHERNATQ